LNEFSQYEMKIPSTNKTVQFRPYLVKEEKILLTAFESDDDKEGLRAIYNTVLACCKDVDGPELKLYDVMHMFNAIRSRSVGETADLTIKCKHCGTPNPVEIDVDSVEIGEINPNKTIKIDKYEVEVSHPTFLQSTKNDALVNGGSIAELMISLIADSIRIIRTEDERLDVSEYPKKQIIEFVESMTREQFQEFWDFLDDVPKLSFQTEFDCASCEKNNKIIIGSNTDFF